ncbi:YaaC family protein [Streptomyces sp. ISL-43]|nr:hypothetical protein [Streptomyces sp. ISL-43]
MLVRYEPAAWARLIAVDNNQHAVLIEGLLQHAIDHLPALVVSAIEAVSC